MTDSSDHVSGKTGLTLTITASKDGGVFASISPTVTERVDGWYNLALTAPHTDTLGDIAIHVTATGADPSDMLCRVTARVVDDVLPTASYTAPDNASIAAILLDTAEIGVAGAGLTVLASASDLSIVAGYIDTEVTAIKTKTDNLPVDTAATLATINAYVDELESRLTALRAAALDNLDATISSRLATSGYTAPPSAINNADAVWSKTLP